MDIIYKNTKLKKSLTQRAELIKLHGPKRANKIRLRLAVLSAVKTLKDLWPPFSGPERCHELTKGRRSNQLSVDLDHPYRLIFIPNHNPIPKREEGGLDWSQVTAVKILGVEDTHG